MVYKYTCKNKKGTLVEFTNESLEEILKERYALVYDEKGHKRAAYRDIYETINGNEIYNYVYNRISGMRPW